MKIMIIPPTEVELVVLLSDVLVSSVEPRIISLSSSLLNNLLIMTGLLLQIVTAGNVIFS